MPEHTMDDYGRTQKGRRSAKSKLAYIRALQEECGEEMEPDPFSRVTPKAMSAAMGRVTLQENRRNRLLLLV